jgi:hypothetical protein
MRGDGLGIWYIILNYIKIKKENMSIYLTSSFICVIIYLCLVRELQNLSFPYAYKHLFYIHNLKGMIKTKIQKAIAIASIAALSATTLGSTFAANIGTASINGGASSNVVWDDTFPGTATGTVTGIIVTAQVLPTLNMVISTGAIDLGILTA